MLFYKVVEIKQKSFTRGYMTTMDLQNVINEWANLGWILDRLTSGETQGFLHAKDVFLLIFKREVQIPQGLHIIVNNQQVPVNSYNFLSLRKQGLINSETPAIKPGENNWQNLGIIAPELAETLSMIS